MKTSKEILTEARALVAKGFCHGAYAKTKEGTTLLYPDINSEEAIQFCAAGAIIRAAGAVKDGQFIPDSEDQYKEYWAARDAIRLAIPTEPSLFAYNDTHKQEEILALFDKALATLETP